MAGLNETTDLSTYMDKATYSAAVTGKVDLSAIEGEPIKALTVAAFQTYTATGDFTDPVKLNDTITANTAYCVAADKYVEVAFGHLVKINQYRLYGNAAGGAAHRVKITYWNEGSQSWIDWITGIVTNISDWSGWITSGGTIVTRKIRMVSSVATATLYVGELEIKG